MYEDSGPNQYNLERASGFQNVEFLWASDEKCV